MAMISSGECQWVHWVRGVTERPWTVGVAEDDMVVFGCVGVDVGDDVGDDVGRAELVVSCRG
jgi:hypothetical protein